MKIKYALLILAFAAALRFFAMTFKFYHWPGASDLIIVSEAALIIAYVCVAYAIATNKKVRELLNGK